MKSQLLIIDKMSLETRLEKWTMSEQLRQKKQIRFIIVTVEQEVTFL